MKIDHLALIKGDPIELKRFRKLLLESQAGTVVDVAVMHETDGSCCARESWQATLVRITDAIRPGSLITELGDTPQ